VTDDFVVQCDFCGMFVPVASAYEAFEHRRVLADGHILVTIGTYCGRYCASRATTATIPTSTG
jgi:hypothetical protein